MDNDIFATNGVNFVKLLRKVQRFVGHSLQLTRVG